MERRRAKHSPLHRQQPKNENHSWTSTYDKCNVIILYLILGHLFRYLILIIQCSKGEAFVQIDYTSTVRFFHEMLRPYAPDWKIRGFYESSFHLEGLLTI